MNQIKDSTKLDLNKLINLIIKHAPKHVKKSIDIKHVSYFLCIP